MAKETPAKETVERARFPGSEGSVAPVREEPIVAPEPKNERVVRRAAPVDESGSDDEGLAEPMVDYRREDISAHVGSANINVNTVEALMEEQDHEDHVPLLFPKEVRLQAEGIMHVWGPGVHLVPVSIAGATPKDMHWYLKHNKVRRAGGAVPGAK